MNLPEIARIMKARGYTDMSCICDWADAFFEGHDQNVEFVLVGSVTRMFVAVPDERMGGEDMLYAHNIVSTPDDIATGLARAEKAFPG